MSEKPKNNGKKSNTFRTAALFVLLSGLSAGGLQCMKEVPMNEEDPYSPKITWIAKKRMGLSECLIDKKSLSGVFDCFNPFESDDDKKDEESIDPKKDQSPGKKDTPKKSNPGRMVPDGGESALG